MRGSRIMAEKRDVDEDAAETDPTGRYLRRPKMLGKGVFKTVYKAFDNVDALEVAWNKLPIDRFSQADIEKTQQVLEVLKNLYHKNIINSFASWLNDRAEPKVINFITELMVFGTLKEFINSSKASKGITLKVIRKWCTNILQALKYLHNQTPSLLHRDLRCENIFLNGHVGEVKIGDMGLSSLKEGEKTFTVIGSPEFMAPELHNNSYTEKVDIYAFGMCMLEMITMENPYSECESPAMVLRKVSHREKPLGLLRMKDGDVKDVITRCLGDPVDRPSAAELLDLPLFANWQSDDGVTVNLDLVPKTLSNEQAQKEERVPSSIEVTLGPLVVRNMPAIDRDVVISRNAPVESEETIDEDADATGQVHSFSPPPHPLPNDRGEIRVGVHIPYGGTVKKVEFMFDLSVDSVADIASEMKTEFELDEERAKQVKDEIEAQVSSYTSENKAERRSASVPGSTAGGSVRSTSPEPSLTSALSALTSAKTRLNREQMQPSIAGQSDQPPSVPPTPTIAASEIPLGNDDLMDTKTFALSMSLMEACKQGDEDAVRARLSQGALVNFANYDKRTPMHLAIEGGHLGIVSLLLEKGSRLNVKDRWGATPLSLAVDQKTGSMDKNVLEYLRNHGVMIPEMEAKTLERSPSLELIDACKRGEIEQVREKLMAGASVDFTDDDGRTSLHFASLSGLVSICELLLINGADPTSKDRYGVSPAQEAADHRRTEVLRLFVSYGVMISSIEGLDHEKSMDINEQAHAGRVDMLQKLVDMGADVNFHDYDHRYPLHLAAKEGHTNAVKLLLSLGARRDVKDRWGLTPLDEARRFKRSEVEALLEQTNVPPKALNGTSATFCVLTEAADAEVLSSSMSVTNLSVISDLISIDDLKKASMQRKAE